MRSFKDIIAANILSVVSKEKQPDTNNFVNPFNDAMLLKYFSGLLPRFQTIRFLGLPSLKEHPDVLLERIYVPLYLGKDYVKAKDIEKVEKATIADILQKRRRLIILGDPGSGKSTLVNYLTSLFASRKNHLLAEHLGNMIPVPFVLRDYAISKDISFEQLMDQFLQQPFCRDRMTKTDLIPIMEKGQALIFLDGLDEIGDIQRRKALRKAILEEGIKKYPNCIWVMTSRIVGYDDVRFDKTRERKKEEHAESLDLYYLLPFNNEQIKIFIQKWYLIREEDEALRNENITSLLQAISESPSIEQLAHTPNLLTIMALIFRIEAQLPSGRCKLYEKITQAYLESIDQHKFQKKGSRFTTFSADKHRQWLSALAYDMQNERSKNKGDEETLIPVEKVKETMRKILGEQADIEGEISYIARRSGLLLPRKPGFYNFVHLSFQEFFAALYLYEQLMGFNTRDRALRELNALCRETVWHESIVFLFEKLSEHSEASDAVFSKLFPQTDNIKTTAVLMIAQLLGDLQSGLSKDNLNKASEMILRRAGKESNVVLENQINILPDEIWQRNFLSCIQDYLKSKKVTSELLLFLQNLKLLEFSQLDSILVPTVLLKISDNMLYDISPLMILKDGSAYHELIQRMPIKYWFSNYYSHYFYPLLSFSDHEIMNNFLKKNDFLIWSTLVDLLLHALWLKLFIMTKGVGFSLVMEGARALERARDRAKVRTLVMPLERARVRALERAFSLKPEWVRKLVLVLALERARERALMRALELTMELTFLPELEQARKLALEEELFALPMQVPAALLRGDDAFIVTDINTDKEPLKLIYRHLAMLILGRGTLRDWEIINEQTKIIRNPAWIHTHLPYLKSEEMETALEMLGLHSNTEKQILLFETAWFEQGHELAPALHAKPSAFVKTIESNISIER